MEIKTQPIQPPSNSHIMVALSGGVDSATSAALLQRSGYKVSGVFMRNWEDDDGTAECTSMKDWLDVQRVGDKLKIEVHQVNFSDIYKSKVFLPFLRSLSMGFTPNPDILCNTVIKFSALREYVKSSGADYLATGHYARLFANREESYGKDNMPIYLFQAKDKSKCQSYFLYDVGNFSKCLMPLGEMDKLQVRAMAKEFGLHNYSKKDSVGLCFIGKRNFSEFVSNYIDDEPGDIVDQDGKIMGQHRGLFHYTIGQRQGLGIGGQKGRQTNTTNNAKPNNAWFVTDKKAAVNQLVVAQGDDSPALYKKELTAGAIRWIGEEYDFKNAPLECMVKIRYRMPEVSCKVYLTKASSYQEVRVKFAKPQRAITPGQSAVFYSKARCLGGSIIKS